jgi:peptide deformylase
MNMEIVQIGNPVLRATASAVTKEEFGSPTLVQLVEDMKKMLDPQEDAYSVGVALAAPQIGVSKRIFIVRYDRTDRAGRRSDTPPPAEVGVFINPTIIRSSRRRVEMDEGCLSVRNVYGKVLRHERVTVRAQDEYGKVFERGGGGLLAEIFQHEIDHLNGVLFIDLATDTREVAHEGVEDEA